MFIDKIKVGSHQLTSYPFNLELFKSPFELDTSAPVIIFLGENGSGKSSLLKLIQAKLSVVEISIPFQDQKIKLNHTPLELKKSFKKVSGYFFESLSFINYIDYIKHEIESSKKMIEEVDETYKDKSDYAKMMAKSPYHKTIYELKNMYEHDLSTQSHGESYLDFFKSRMRDHQLYLLDEPETPLSTQNQLVLTSMIMNQVGRGCQFMIATHSPILAAIPNAIIYLIKDDQFLKVAYEDVESINLLKQFLNHREQFLKHL